MKVIAVGALLNVGGAAAWGPSPTFDCAMRKLAYTYGKQLLPRMGEYESLYYALDLNDTTCSTPMASNAASSGKVARAPAPLPLGAKLFVDPTAGSDASKLGAMESPLRTVQEALNRAAIIEPTPAVVLREGTHYIADSLLLTPAHSNLHMLGYPGETATISGGIVLTNLDWKPYVTPTPAPASEWTTEDNDDYVWSYVGGDPNFPTLGKPASKEACQALCAAHKDCHAYTWHDTNQGGYSLMCVGRLDGGVKVTARPKHRDLRRDDSLLDRVEHGGGAAARDVGAEADVDPLTEQPPHGAHPGADVEVRCGAVHDGG
jgi:hypothetical protein